MSITRCLKKLGSSVNPDDAAEVKALAKTYRDEGMDAVKAGTTAARDVLETLIAERKRIVGLIKEAGGQVEEEDATAQENMKSKPSPNATASKIDDFGEVLQGAKKHTYTQKLQNAKSVDITAAPLSESWPEPDYQKLLDEGIDPWTVSFIRAAREEIPVKPKKSWKLKRWATGVESLRSMSEGLLDGTIQQFQVRNLLTRNEYRNIAEDVGGRTELYMAVGHGKSLKGIRIRAGQYSMLNGVEYNPPKTVWSVEKQPKLTVHGNWPTMIATGKTREEAIAEFKKAYDKLDTSPEAKAPIRFDIYQDRGKNAGQYFIGKKIGKNTVRLKYFDDLKSARQYLSESRAELEKMLDKYKDIPYERNHTNSPRIGIDHRNGADITPDQFGETFGFRGVQFGNWVEGDKRQKDLNEAYDALLDMAGVLNIPAKALSLNGELGLAFGARGKGGKDAASAHYEPGTVVINLTKKAGSGSLAHEWWHALDNYFSRMRGKGYEKTFVTNYTKTYPGDTRIRPAMVSAFEGVMDAIKKSGMPARAAVLDLRKSQPYWTTSEELSARSFESYIIAKLQDQGQSNNYLANIVSKDYWDAATALGMEMENSYPYPESSEIPSLRAAYDNFFDVIESRETDKGVALFSLEVAPDLSRSLTTDSESEFTVEQAEKAIAGARDAVSEKAGLKLEVITSGQIPPRIASQAGRKKIKGYLSKGTIYLVANHLKDARDAQITFAHEVKGHFGVENTVGPEGWRQIMDGFTQLEKSNSDRFRSIMDEVTRRYGKLDDLTRAKEFIAVAAERRESEGMVGRFMRMVREIFAKALRAIGFNRMYSMTDIDLILSRSEQFLKDGQAEESVSGYEEAMASLTETVRKTGLTKEAATPISMLRDISQLKEHKSYKDAKAGDWKASENLVRDLISRSNYEEAKSRFGEGAIYVPVHAQESTGMNKIPVAMAAAFAQYTNGELDTDILQTNKAFHTGANAMERLVSKPIFSGPVEEGARYVLVDDVSTMGSTLAELANYLTENGAEVVGSILLVNASRTDTMVPSKFVVRELERRFGDEIRSIFGIEPSALTAAEAGYLIGFRDADAIRTRATAARQENGRRVAARLFPKEPPGTEFSLETDPAKSGVSALTDTPAFKRWFGDSRVVDDQGNPLVVYHGTNQDFSEFKPRSEFGKNAEHIGMFFSESKEQASQYAAEYNTGGNPTVMPVYLYMRKPLVVNYENIPPSPRSSKYSGIGKYIQRAKHFGHDGVIIKGFADFGGDSTQYVVFNPTQIKSATGNRGTFDPENPNILFSLDDSDRQYDEPTRAQKFEIYRYISRKLAPLRWQLQDKFIDIKHLQEDFGVTEEQDAYLAESVWQGRAGETILAFEEDRTNPLLEKIAEAKMSLDEVDQWLHARHAKEANAYLKEINPDRKNNDALSGMSDAAAEATLRKYFGNTAIQAAGRMIDSINADRVKMMVDEGLLDQETANTWWATYKHYIPLKREEAETLLPPRGKGFNIKGAESKKRTGSERPVANVVANVIAQYHSTVIRAEKNRVGNALLKFAEANPDPSFWEIDKQKQVASIKDGAVQYFNDPREYDNELNVKVGGKVHTITFNEKNPVAVRIVKAMKNLDQGQMNVFFRYLMGLNRLLSNLNTSLSPEFVISNFARDIQTAFYNMTDTELAGVEMSVLKMVPGALKGLKQNIRNKDKVSEWSVWAERFKRAGGKTGWIDHYNDISELSDSLKNELQRLQTGKDRTPLYKIGKAIEEYNMIVENGIRLAAFRKAVELGMSELRAAGIAKNLTVNFNRKGMMGPVLNSLYLFYNASFQGATRLLQAMISSRKGRKLSAATIGFAVMLDILNRAISGDDDDGENIYDNLPEYVKSRNLIVMGNKEPVFKFPLPWGYNVLHVIGQQVGDMLTGDRFNALNSAGTVAISILDAFNPIGGGSILQTLSPTIFDPMVQIAENKDWSGSPLKPQALPFGPEKPEYLQHWSSSREISKQIAETANDWSGGDEVRPGGVNISPEWIDVFIDFFTGSAGRVVADTFNITQKLVTGEPIKGNEIPVWRKLYGQDVSSSLQSRYYEWSEDVQYADKQIKDLEGEERDKARKTPQAKLIWLEKATRKNLTSFRKQKKVAEAEGNRERADKFDQKIRQEMAKFNKKYAEAIFSDTTQLPLSSRK